MKAFAFFQLRMSVELLSAIASADLIIFFPVDHAVVYRAVVCQSHFCICPVPMVTSSFRICFEYIKFYDSFSSFNHTFSLLVNTLSEFIPALMFLNKACRSWRYRWIQPNPISICHVIYNLIYNHHLSSCPSFQ